MSHDLVGVHTADLHVSPSGSRLAENGRNARLMDRFDCARHVFADGVEQGAQFFLVCGDLWLTPRPTPLERRLILDAFAPALEARKSILVLAGNHDFASGGVTALDVLRPLPGVRIAERAANFILYRTERGPVGFREESESKPSDLGIVAWPILEVDCVPWPDKQSVFAQAALGRGITMDEGNRILAEYMTRLVRALHDRRIERRKAVRDLPAILAAHLTVESSRVGKAGRLMQLGEDWTIDEAAIAIPSGAWDYVALGHIHKPQTLGTVGTPIVYPGSPEAIFPDEAGEAKEYRLLRIEGKPLGDGNRILSDGRGTPYRPFVTLDMTGDPAPDLVEVIRLAGGIEKAIVRIVAGKWTAEAIGWAKQVEDAGAVEVSLTLEAADPTRRRVVEVTEEMGSKEALSAWLDQRPDLAPVREGILAEAGAIEEELRSA